VDFDKPGSRDSASGIAEAAGLLPEEAKRARLTSRSRYDDVFRPANSSSHWVDHGENKVGGRGRKDANHISAWRDFPACDKLQAGSRKRRALMLPQELKAMGPDTAVFLSEGIPHPVKCRKIRYYEDRYFTARLLAPVEVPRLKA